MTQREAKSLIIALDTAGDVAGVALADGDTLLGEVTWRARQSHSRQLLPTLDWLLKRFERTKDDIGGICICLGPGSYAGLRVGLSTAKALAYALDVPLSGVGRLAADAWPVAQAHAGRVVAVHAAGRAELAFAAYAAGDDGLRELIEPQLGPTEALTALIEAGDVVTAELPTLPPGVLDALQATGTRVVEAAATRVVGVLALGRQRLAAGAFDSSDSLVPLYLRPPAIGPQKSPPRP